MQSALRTQEWLDERRKGIGGSDAAAVLGMNRFSSPYAVWADKVGILPQQDENERMRLGRHLEPYVATRFTEISGIKVRNLNAILYNKKYPFALANIDRRIVGEKAGLEIKTTSSINTRRFAGGDYPDEYYIQCVHYLAVTGWDKWYLCVLILGSPDEPIIYEIERDEFEIKALMEQERDFWERYVVTGTPPPMDGTQATGNALSAIYSETRYDAITIGQETAITNFVALQAQIRALEDERDKWKHVIQGDMGEYELAQCGRWNIYWKSQTRKTFDYKAFIADNDDLDLDAYFKTNNFRKFEIREVK